MIEEQEAILSARRVADAHAEPPWRTVDIVGRRDIAGYDCWVVLAREGFWPDAEESDKWGSTGDTREYFIDVLTGMCVGLGFSRGQHLFVTPDGLIDIVTVLASRRNKGLTKRQSQT